MKGKVILFISLLLILLPNFVAAATWGDVWNGITEFFSNLTTFPSEWLEFPNLIFRVIVPYLGIWMIIYGFLTALRIFGMGRNQYYLILSFLITFGTIPTNIFYTVVQLLFSVMGMWSVGVFAFIFFVGTWMMGQRMWGRRGVTGALIRDYRSKIENAEVELENLRLQLAKKPGDAGLMAAVADWRKKRREWLDAMSDITAF